MKNRGKIRTESGGRYIEIPLMYAKNETITWIGKGGTVSLADTEHLTVCKWDWKYLVGNVTRYFTDEQKNKGVAAHIKMMTSKLDNLQMSLIDELEICLHGDGTRDSSLALQGLEYSIVADPTTGTVADLSRATYSWWRNQTTDMTNRPSELYLLKDMRTLNNDCIAASGQQMSDIPDIVVADQTTYEKFEDEVMEQKYIVNKELGDAFFDHVVFRGKPVIWSPQATASTMKFLNTRFLELVIDSAYNFQMTEWKGIPDQPNDRVAQVVLTANLVASRLCSCGTLHSIT